MNNQPFINEDTIKTIIKQISILEKRNKALQIINSLLWIILVVIFLTGAIQSKSSGVIQARELQIVDSSGRVRICLGIINPLFGKEKRPALEFYDSNNERQICLESSIGSNELLIKSKAGKISLLAEAGEPNIRPPKTGITIYEYNDTNPSLDTTSCLLLNSQQLIMDRGTFTPRVGLVQISSGSSSLPKGYFFLRDKDKNVIFKASNQ